MAFIGTNEQPTVTIGSGLSGSEWNQRIDASTSAVLLLSSSEGRTQGTIFNHGSAGLYVHFGSIPTVNFFKVKLSSGSYYEMPQPMWRGPVYGIWDAANGWAMVQDISGNVSPSQMF